MIYPEGQRRSMGPRAQVPDESRIETQLWFYYQAASYIDVGCEGIHSCWRWGMAFQKDENLTPGRCDARVLMDRLGHSWDPGCDSAPKESAFSPANARNDFLSV